MRTTLAAEKLAVVRPNYFGQTGSSAAIAGYPSSRADPPTSAGRNGQLQQPPDALIGLSFIQELFGVGGRRG
jgi:hypothetical protein